MNKPVSPKAVDRFEIVLIIALMTITCWMGYLHGKDIGVTRASEACTPAVAQALKSVRYARSQADSIQRMLDDANMFLDWSAIINEMDGDTTTYRSLEFEE